MKKLTKKSMGGGNDEPKFSRKVTKKRYADNRESNGNPLGSEPKSGTLKHIVRTRPTITGGSKTTVKAIYNNDGPGGVSGYKTTYRTNSKGEMGLAKQKTLVRKMGGSTKKK